MDAALAAKDAELDAALSQRSVVALTPDLVKVVARATLAELGTGITLRELRERSEGALGHHPLRAFRPLLRDVARAYAIEEALGLSNKQRAAE
jgi:hypothetical protein